MPEQSGDSFDFYVLFRVYFTGKGAGERGFFVMKGIGHKKSQHWLGAVKNMRSDKRDIVYLPFRVFHSRTGFL